MQQNLKEIEIDAKTLPIILKVVYNDNVKKDYVIRLSKDKQGVYLNKKEY